MNGQLETASQQVRADEQAIVEAEGGGEEGGGEEGGGEADEAADPAPDDDSAEARRRLREQKRNSSKRASTSSDVAGRRANSRKKSLAGPQVDTKESDEAKAAGDELAARKKARAELPNATVTQVAPRAVGVTRSSLAPARRLRRALSYSCVSHWRRAPHTPC